MTTAVSFQVIKRFLWHDSISVYAMKSSMYFFSSHPQYCSNLAGNGFLDLFQHKTEYHEQLSTDFTMEQSKSPNDSQSP
jgi:hypothetical protein